jgi:hypothetical protein
MNPLNSQNTPAFGLIDFSQIQRQPIQEWQLYHQEGEQYLNVAIAAIHKRRTVFTPRILYNLLAMAIEKLIMAALMERGRLPYNHTMHDLAEAMEAWLPERIAALSARIRETDRFQDICDLHEAVMPDPSMQEIEEMVELCRQLHERLERTGAAS